MSINNAVSDKIMVDPMTKSESKVKMNAITGDELAKYIGYQAERERVKMLKVIAELEQRIIRMERAYDALGRRLEGSERHVEDEGWFD